MGVMSMIVTVSSFMHSYRYTYGHSSATAQAKITVRKFWNEMRALGARAQNY